MEAESLNELTVFFIVHTMSNDVARKGSLVTKTYRDKVMLRRFPESVPPQAAIAMLFKEFGDRPSDGKSGTQVRGHTYVEIRGWKLAPKFIPPELPPEEKLDQKDMFQ